MTFSLYDVVKLRERVRGGMDDGSDVPAGSIGTIVDMRQEGTGPLYLVEICDAEGRTLAICGVSGPQLEPAE